MAKGNPVLGTMSGKLGDLVFYRREGRQISRARVREIKNPNSQKQQVQRMVMTTAAQAYSAFKRICDHSFEGIQVGQKSMSYFLSKNADLLRGGIEAAIDGTLTGDADFNFCKKGNNRMVANPYIISKGTLAPVAVPSQQWSLLPDAGKDGDVFYAIDGRSAGNFDAQFNEWVLRNNAQRGDWFTICYIEQLVASASGNDAEYRFRFLRLVVDVDSDGKLMPVPSLTQTEALNNVTLDKFFTSTDKTTDNITPIIFTPYKYYGVSKDDSYIVALGIIHSRQQVDQSWLRSNCVLTMANTNTQPDAIFKEDLDSILESWAGLAEAKGVGDYVLQGGSL